MPAPPALSRSISAGAGLPQSIMQTARCGICLEDMTRAVAVSLCARKCEAVFCGSCAREYLMTIVGRESLMAFCPRVECPGCRTFVPTDRWRGLVPEEIGARYDKNAGIVLSLQCGACDRRNTLLPPHADGVEAPALEAKGVAEAMERHMEGDREAGHDVVRGVVAFASSDGAREALQKCITELRDAIAAGETEWRRRMGEKGGSMRVMNTAFKAARKRSGRARAAVKADPESKEAAEECAAAHAEAQSLKERRSEAVKMLDEELSLTKMRGELRTKEREAEADDGEWRTMEAVLQTVRDEERRASLMLCYLRHDPIVRSRCHKLKHCFRCKVARGHPGVSCEVYQARHLPKEVRFCPNCNVPVMKGDGCNSLKCAACTHAFRWTDAKKAE